MAVAWPMNCLSLPTVEPVSPSQFIYEIDIQRAVLRPCREKGDLEVDAPLAAPLPFKISVGEEPI